MENPADWIIPTGTTGTAPAHTGTPVRMNTVVVLGDSLSDIGQKWTTKSGRAARAIGQMYVSPTGRFSDCRNWTDFMFEAACGQSLVADTANGSIALSQKHFSYSPECGAFQMDQRKRFWYANYAAGGACGDTPAQKADFLGTCKEQVDGFELDCMKSLAPLGNTLFIIWFGANDLYTAGCQAEHMAKVASVVASEQRARLLAIFKMQNAGFGLQNCVCKFIFVEQPGSLSAAYRHQRRGASDRSDVQADLAGDLRTD
jgi:phospholipase/lecithinase/hemolysin